MEPQQTPLVNTPEVTPTPNNNLLLIIGGLIILILVGFGSYILGTKSQKNKVVTQSPTTILTPTTITISPTIIDTTANWQTYNDSQYNYLFKYPEQDERGKISVNVFDSTNSSSPFKGEKNASIGYANSDVGLMGFYISKSDLSETDWWNTIGLDEYRQLVKESHDALSPTNNESVPPTFTISYSSIGGKKALVARGNLELNQGGGDTIVSVVSNDGYIFMFDQSVDVLPNKLALTKSNAILSTFTFTK